MLGIAGEPFSCGLVARGTLWPARFNAGLPFDIGYCHLGGPAISDSDTYGTGLVNVATP